MATTINITMRRNTSSGVACCSTRPIVVLRHVTNEDYDRLESELAIERQAYEANTRTPMISEHICKVCDRIFGDQWAFVTQGGGVEF